MSYTTLLYETAGRVARITLNRPEKLNAINQAMRHSFRYARFVVALALGVIPLALCGCGMSSRNPWTNRALWNTRLPKDKTFRGAVFLLEDMPTQEFALLLAEKFPQSYVVAVPPREFKDKASFTYGASQTSYSLDWETDIPYLGTRCRGGIALPRYIIFHEMRMTADDNPPLSASGAPVLRLSWSYEPKKRVSPTFFQRAKSYAIGVPTLLTAASVFPPPVSSSCTDPGYIPARQHLGVADDSGTSKTFLAEPRSEAYIDYGFIWSLPMMFVASDSDAPYFSEGHRGRSPGGWADCLEQMFRDPDMLKYLESCSSEGMAARDDWFRERCDKAEYTLQPLLKQHNYTLRAGYGFVNSKVPESLVYIWTGFEDGTNHFSEQ